MIQVQRPDVPLVCREADRTFLWMPLDAGAVIPPAKPERYVVDLGLALCAAERFFRGGELEPSLEWEPY